MNNELTIVQTADGSNTIYNPQVGETYHSRHGALQESQHVFLQSGLQYFLETTSTQQISILEVGFGTGLNFLLTADFCMGQKINLEYTGIEAYPLNHEMISDTGYEQYTSPEIWREFITNYPSALHSSTKLNPYCQLQIANCQLLNFQSDTQFDVIYFDAFAAIHQPEMWNEEAIGHTVKFLKPGGVFVTYAITGNLKRMLKGLGLQIQKIPGAAGKREMLRAVK
ncbi:MAG: tRNA (5-methylaminomethyl-2-thiouridylate)-methyltransferase [Mucilaginibacter sp.]|uniref:tRNA (5-methylaminomethyl-2-thiouridine)(34)-methyltransferase MnmD n=1 Tax=Mucilaginibacter sp. TaxID=1882438 RepID=UPI002620FC74|nr:tRNA (5-methylaminomethyl-2-thiouridine)(34)-methyltransferase MnmD [Mucilaginibacter sp.]MDB5002435.1 tRNA (5-methylaminomethyl-2-thiouridylate)-methyltransferase [Mucilaginibacter sp.]